MCKWWMFVCKQQVNYRDWQLWCRSRQQDDVLGLILQQDSATSIRIPSTTGRQMQLLLLLTCAIMTTNTWTLASDLAFNSDYVYILHRFWDIATYWSKIATCNLRHLCSDRCGISTRFFGVRKLYSPWRCWLDPRFCRLDTDLWRTDEQMTDGQTHDNNIYCTIA